ncbi:MAG: NAD-dependent epimerase/dehydratase family protein [Candidatus Nanopelagicales bacterium]
MRILVTGCLGYLGPAVLEALRVAYPNAHLAGLDSGLFMEQNDGSAPSPDRFLDVLVLRDLRALTAKDLDGYSHLVHLAAISNDPMGREFEQVTFDVNRDQSIRIAVLAREAALEGFTFASSCSVYGAGDQQARSESDPLAPQTAYATSKVQAEVALATLATDDFRVTCLRFATACGWSPRIRLDLVLNDFVASAITQNRIDVLSDGTPWRPLIHVRDMARAVEWSVSTDRDMHPSYVVANVGSNSWNYRIADLADAVASHMDAVDVVVNRSSAPDTRSYRVSFDYWGSLAPGHQPQVSLHDAISELVPRLRALPDLDAQFRQSRRMRLVRLRQLRDDGFLTPQLTWAHEGPSR